MSVDSHMVIETNRAIPDSLGNVQVIISDKTGTLTKNELKCEKLIFNCDPFASTPQEFSLTNPAGIKQAIQRRDDQSKAVERFLTFMAVANGVMPKARPNAENLTKETVYFSSNPDDLEFVNIAKALDTELMERFTSTEGQQFVRVRTRLDDAPEEDEVRWHTVKMQLLQEHEFVSSRKYMSAVLKCPGSGGELNLRSSLSSSPCQVLLVLKGADEKVDAKLSSESPYKNRLIDLVSPYTREGKRVLVWAYKFIPLQDYERWEKERPASTKDAEAIESWWKLIERDLHFAGCTIVSDKLQDGVEDVITYARECGIKVVMATGDSADTAESIWRKLRQIQGPVHRLVYNSFTTLNSEQRVVLDELKLRDSLAQFDAIKADDRAVLLIDGDMLLALQKARRERRKFAKSLDKFDSVVAARMTAAQKAEINRLYQSLGKTTLAIGDGANDITMIQEATVSVGLKSAETESAAQAADFKIQEFRNLQGLLVYGLQNYFRLSTVYLWNDYKAIVLALTPFISRWWSAYTSGGNVRGESIIPGDVIFMLTTVVLSLPVVMFGIFDVPISVQELVASPRHYKVHRHKRFDTKKKLMWWLSACIHTCIILYTIINYWADHANALVIGVMTGQIIAVVTNMRLIFEARRGFHVADSWRLLIASFASMVLTIPVSNLNPAFDAERRLKISGTLDLPKLDWAHVQTVLLVAGICLAVDVMLYALFGESHVLSYWKRRNQTGAGSSQAVDDEDDDDDDAPPASHPKSD
jgi:phospholipid-transporting ATPase